MTMVALFLFAQNLFAQQKVDKWDRFELTLNYNVRANAFKEVQLSAKFVAKDTTFVVNGFYDGNQTFKIRFMPPKEGRWSYITTSNVPALNNKTGSFECISPSTPNNHGMVGVSDVYNFKYDDGTRYYPFGTTAYAWTHMAQGVQELTLKSLEKAGFNKVRMCVFPKNYELVKEEPQLYPFVIKQRKKGENGEDSITWDFDQFNPLFFQHLENRIDDLSKLGIEADLILFHPYDKGRWGFDAMPNEVNIRYINYLVARLSSYRNIWWSMANEFDYVASKTRKDWDLLSKTVVQADPYRHLCSIHGSTAMYYEYWKPDYTHVSIQDEAPVSDFGRAAILRNAYYKPIVYDEVCYEGNLKSRWGRLSGEEMLHNIWQGLIAGTYVTHGESYMFKNASDTIFWAKGGELVGSSWKRISFTRTLIESCPQPLELADISRDNRTASAGENYYIIYFGKQLNDEWLFNLPSKNSTHAKLKPGTTFKVDIIDTWDMTITPCNQLFETGTVTDYRLYDKELKRVRLPLKPYIALRITEIK